MKNIAEPHFKSNLDFKSSLKLVCQTDFEKKWPKLEKELRRVIAAQKKEAVALLFPLQIDITWASLAKIKAINFKYRKKNKATDVLSFPSPPNYQALTGHLGDIVICLPLVKRQAKQQLHTELEEFWVLLIHGVLHLLGFDHEQGLLQAKVMQAHEKHLIKKVLKAKPGSKRKISSSLIERSQSSKRAK